MFQRKIKAGRRRGVSAVQVALVLGAITLAIIASVQLVGRNTNQSLDDTADMAADPASLAAHFRSEPQQSSGGDDDLYDSDD